MKDIFIFSIIWIVLIVVILGGAFVMNKTIYAIEKTHYENLMEKDYDVRMVGNKCMINISNNIDYCTNTYRNELKIDYFLESEVNSEEKEQ